jgi:hypothetical protein
MKRYAVLPALSVALLLLFAPASASRPDLSFSAGVGGGSYHPCFVAGLTTGQTLWPSIHAEEEFFYYRQPGRRSQDPGLAITSTALDVNFSILLQDDTNGRKVVPYVALTAGGLYESETWKYALTKTREAHSSSRWNAGLGVGAKVFLTPRSGIRVDFRWLRVLGQNSQIQRYSLGFIYRL